MRADLHRRSSSIRLGLREANPWVVLAGVVVFVLSLTGPSKAGDEVSAASKFRDQIEPLLADHCYACHGGGIKKGSVTLDGFTTDESILGKKELWSSVLKNVRGGLMPPAGKPRLSADELKSLESWIKRGAFALDPLDPDPGRVTVRRLNRVEYRNTIRDLMGIDFRADEEFPADDSGYGFDNIGDALSVSPLLLEKYMQAAETIVATAVPTVARVVKVQTINGGEFHGENGGGGGGGGRGFGGPRGGFGGSFSLYNPAKLTKTFQIDKAGSYKVSLDLATRGQFNFDPGRGKVTLRLDDKELMSQEFGWADAKKTTYEYPVDFEPGSHTLSFRIEPLTPTEQRKTNVDFRILGGKVEGPLAESEWVRPDNFDRFFDRDEPGTSEARKSYAREILTRFASKAYRRPADPRTVEKLIRIAEDFSSAPGKNFAQGIGQAMTAVLASPRFLFRVESSEPTASPKGFSPVDEYSLASRLSYFLWSTMPDGELMELASRHELRKNLQAQVKRMLADPKSEELIKNFTGQWLQSRDYENFPIQARAILRRDGLPSMLDTEVGELKRSMKRETEAYFSHIVREDRPILELIDSNYAFLNQTLAKLYGVPDVTGREVRKVTLPEGNSRGGLLTQAGLLMITSNPGRNSAVKRGAFILENILGTPTPPPPPDIPALEEALNAIKDREPTMREVMEAHRSEALCAACHNRMDPLGLAFENYNAMGIWRDQEKKQPIDASGKLINGRTFKNAQELKQILLTENKLDVYRCLTEKLMTYALGRGPEYQDVEAVDQIVDQLDKNNGRFSVLLTGIIESSPFQKRRNLPAIASKTPTETGAKP